MKLADTITIVNIIFSIITTPWLIPADKQAMSIRKSRVEAWHGFTVALALIGTVIAALIAGKPADRFGRKRGLITIAALYTLSALGSALGPNWWFFIVSLFIGGLGVGASSVIGPMYVAEISTAHLRGSPDTGELYPLVYGGSGILGFSRKPKAGPWSRYSGIWESIRWYTRIGGSIYKQSDGALRSGCLLAFENPE